MTGQAGLIMVVMIVVGIAGGVFYLFYWDVEASDCRAGHQYVRPDLNSHLGNAKLDKMNEEYYSCLEGKYLPVLEKVRLDVDFVKE